MANPGRNPFDSGLRVWRHAPGAMSAPHVHEQIEVLVVTRGRLRHHQCGISVDLGPGELVAFWAAFPHHTISSSPDVATVVLYVPLEWFLGQPAWTGQISAWMGRGLLRRRDPAQIGWAERCLDAFADGSPAGLHRLRLLTELHLLDLATGQNSAVRPADAALGRHVQAMIRLILTRFAEPLTIADIARAAGLHPTYAAGVFRRVTGLSPWAFVLQVRTAEAQHLLLDAQRSVLDVGLAAGFGSEARFHAIFRRLTGTTPDRYRRPRRQRS